MQSPYESPYQQAAPQLQYVSVGPRFLAVPIDGILIGIVNAIIGAVLHNSSAVGAITGLPPSVLYAWWPGFGRDIAPALTGRCSAKLCDIS